MLAVEVNTQEIKIAFRLPHLLYGFFLIAMIIDIGGAFGLKYISFAILMTYTLIVTARGKVSIPSNFIILEGLLFIVAPVFFFFLAITAFSVTPAAAIGKLTPFATFFLYPFLLLINPKEKIISFFTTTLFWGSVLMVIIFLAIAFLYILGQHNLISSINTFTSNYRLGYFGQRPFGESFGLFFPNVYFRWTLLLIPAGILLWVEKKMRFIIVVLAVFLTSSTAAILFLVLGLFWVMVDNLLIGNSSKSYFKRFILFIIVLLGIFLALYLSSYDYVAKFVADKLHGSSVSTSIKIGHIKSIIDIMSNDILRLILGMGMGSSFYSTGVEQVVTNVEVSHFNLIREFGLTYALGFCSYVIFLFISLRKVDRIGKLLSIGLAMIFLAAGTNPLLISPVFFIVVVISRAYITLNRREKMPR